MSTEQDRRELEACGVTYAGVCAAELRKCNKVAATMVCLSAKSFTASYMIEDSCHYYRRRHHHHHHYRHRHRRRRHVYSILMTLNSAGGCLTQL